MKSSTSGSIKFVWMSLVRRIEPLKIACRTNVDLRMRRAKQISFVRLNCLLVWFSWLVRRVPSSASDPITGFPQNRDFKIQRRDGDKNVAQKVNLSFFSLYSDYSYPLTVNCRRTLLKLNFKGPYSSSEREIKLRRCLFTSSIKREIRHFHVVVVQKRERNEQKSVFHVRSCCFAN